MRVVYFQRRPVPGAFSIESYFAFIRAQLDDLDITVSVARHFSSTVRGLLGNIVRAARARGDVNHITGDIHYVAFALPKARTLLTIHDCGFENYRSPVRRALLKYLWFTLPVKCVARVTTNSHYTRDRVIHHTGCAPEKVTVVPVCISPRFARSDYTFNVACPTILQVGTAFNKNVERIFEAVRGLPCRVHVIGRMTEAHRIAARGTEVINSVQLTEDELVQAYEHADLVAFVSTYEGFGMPIVEANVVGRPLITGNVTAMPETAGDAACLVDPLDVAAIRAGIERIIHDEPYRRTLIANGFRNGRRFEVGTVAATYRQLYETLRPATMANARIPSHRE